MKLSKICLIALAASSLQMLQGCSTDADVASHNLSLAADNFEITRRIVFMNTWSDTYLLSITGACSIKSASSNTGEDGIAVTCKVGPNQYKKHYLGLSGNVTYFSEQIQGADVSAYTYKVVFKPQSILSEVDLRTDR